MFMQKNHYNMSGYVMTVIYSVVSLFASFSYQLRAYTLDSYVYQNRVFFYYCSSFLFFFSIFSTVLGAFQLIKYTSSSNVKNASNDLKLISIIQLVFASLMLLLNITSFFICDIENDAFFITLIIILIIFQIVSMIFVIYGLAHNNKNSTETYLNSFEEIIKLKNEHFISDEEYEKRKQEILKNLK